MTVALAIRSEYIFRGAEPVSAAAATHPAHVSVRPAQAPLSRATGRSTNMMMRSNRARGFAQGVEAHST